MGLPSQLRADDGSQAHFEEMTLTLTLTPTLTPTPNPTPNPNLRRSSRRSSSGSTPTAPTLPLPLTLTLPLPLPRPRPRPRRRRRHRHLALTRFDPDGSKDISFPEFASYFAQHGVNRGALLCRTLSLSLIIPTLITQPYSP